MQVSAQTAQPAFCRRFRRRAEKAGRNGKPSRFGWAARPPDLSDDAPIQIRVAHALSRITCGAWFKGVGAVAIGR
jgi:hypothetical protein